eukprot:1159568-Pelagomonas_calceolata.AAC.8
MALLVWHEGWPYSGVGSRAACGRAKQLVAEVSVQCGVGWGGTNCDTGHTLELVSSSCHHCWTQSSRATEAHFRALLQSCPCLEELTLFRPAAQQTLAPHWLILVDKNRQHCFLHHTD